MKVDNDKYPLGIYEQPRECLSSVALGLIDAQSVRFGGVELDKRTSEVVMRNEVLGTVADDTSTDQSIECGGTTLVEVSSFALLLEQALKEDCRTSSSWSSQKIDGGSIRCVAPLSKISKILCACPDDLSPNLCPIGPNSTQTSPYSSPTIPPHPDHICGPIIPTIEFKIQPNSSQVPSSSVAQEAQTKTTKSTSYIDSLEAHTTHSPSSFNYDTLESIIPNSPSLDTPESLSPNIFPSNPSDSTPPNLKRKEHPDLPSTDPKKPRPEFPTAEATLFDLETITIIPKSQLSDYLVEKTEKKDVGIAGFHLPDDEDLEPLTVSQSLLVSGSLDEEVGINMLPPAP